MFFYIKVKRILYIVEECLKPWFPNDFVCTKVFPETPGQDKEVIGKPVEVTDDFFFDWLGLCQPDNLALCSPADAT